MGSRSTFLLLNDFERLEDWCQKVRRIFAGRLIGVFLVGSVLNRADYRDVDVRVVLTDEGFDAEWLDRLKVRYMNSALSTWGQRETGLPIDCQVQRMTEQANDYEGPRNPMGIRDWEDIPTSGTPKAAA